MPSTISAGTTAGTAIAIAGDTTGDLAFQTNGTTTAMTINTSQNVGIGTTAPASKLNVQSASGNYATFSTSGTSKLFVGVDNGTPELVVGASAGDAVIRTQQQLWFGLSGGGVAGRFDSSGNFYMNSGYGSAATAYGCRAWVNFDGTTASPSTRRGSGNVSSVTKNGTGDYTVNFTNAMPDTNYAVSGAARYGDNSTAGVMRVVSIASVGTLASAMSTTSVRVSTQYVNAGAEDQQVVCVAVFR